MNKFGYVVISGKPNVGKSTLLNAIAKRKVAITSPKPQTTRNQIKLIYSDDDSKIVFIDTPGYHNPNNKLDLFLNSEIKTGYKIANIALILIDQTREIDDEDKEIIKILKNYDVKNIICVFTKNDIASKKAYEKIKPQIENLISPTEFLVVSKDDENSQRLLIETIKKHLEQNSENNFDEKIFENKDDFLISELIREQVIFNCRQELPYSTSVLVESSKYNKEENILEINAVVVVEKESQKPIVIGKGGSMIKKIGTMARKELLNIFDCKIILKLFVKVEKEWRNNERFLKEVGYQK